MLACPAATKAEDNVDSIGNGNHNRKCPVCIHSRPKLHPTSDKADHSPYNFLCVGDSFSHHKVRPMTDSAPIFALPGPHGIQLAPCEIAFRPVVAMWTAVYLLLVEFLSLLWLLFSSLVFNVSKILSATRSAALS